MGASQSELAEFVDPGPPVTKDRIVRAIRSWEDTSDVCVDVVEEMAGNARGEGFMSSLSFLRIEARVAGTVKKYDWIIKSTPREANRALMSTKIRLDEREVAFFSDLVPMLEKFLADKDQLHLLPPLCQIPFASWSDDDRILVMQNLKTQGWRDAIDKKQGLDVSHLRLAFKWLASYHAITANFLEEFSGGEEAIRKQLDIFFWRSQDFPEIVKAFDDLREQTNTNLRCILGKIDEKYPGKDRVSRYNSFAEKHQDLNTMAWKLRDDGVFGLRTICHGDTWFNNMMFKYEDTRAHEVMFIDFQLVGYLSPVMDLTYLLSASTTGQVRREHLDHLLTLYHTTFTLTLDRLGSNIQYSYDTFREDYNNSLMWGFSFAVQSLPSICAEKEEEVVDVETWMASMAEEDEEEKKRKLDELMNMEREKLCGNSMLLERIKDLFDDIVEAGSI